MPTHYDKTSDSHEIDIKEYVDVFSMDNNVLI